jgi:hypothetical protein
MHSARIKKKIKQTVTLRMETGNISIYFHNYNVNN